MRTLEKQIEEFKKNHPELYDHLKRVIEGDLGLLIETYGAELSKREHIEGYLAGAVLLLIHGNPMPGGIEFIKRTMRESGLLT